MSVPKGYKWSESSIQRRAEGVRQAYKNGKILPSLLGRVPWNKGLRKDSRLKGGCPKGLVPWNKGQKMPGLSIEHREKIKQGVLRWWRNPENKKTIESRNRNVRLGIIQAVKEDKCQPPIPSSLERQIEAILNKYFPDEWVYSGDGKITIEGYKPDFLNTNGKKLIIEAAGGRWHESHYASQRTQTFAKFGYKTLVIWDRDEAGKRLKKLPEEKTVAMIEDFMVANATLLTFGG